MCAWLTSRHQLQRRDTSRSRERIRVERAIVPNLMLAIPIRVAECQMLHDLGAATDRTARQATCEHLRERRQISGEPGALLDAPRRDTKARNHFVADQ